MLVAFNISRRSFLVFLMFDVNASAVKSYVKVYKGKEEEMATYSLKARDVNSNTGHYASNNVSLYVHPTFIST